MKVENVQVPEGFGRDAGKWFVISEMDAVKAEKWAWRLFIAMKGTAGEVPPEVMQMGMIAVAWRGLNTFLAAPVKFDDIEPLLDEMLTCITMVRDPKHPDVSTPIVSPDDIREVKTLAWLRSEIIRVHTDFSPAAALSKYLDIARAAGTK